MIHQRIRIQNELHEIISTTKTRAVGYTKGKSFVQPNQVIPTGVIVNETDIPYERDENNGRRLVLKKGQWAFEATAQYSQEILTDDILDKFTDPILTLPSVKEGKDQDRLRSVIVYLTRAEPDHKAQSNQQSGTEIRFTFVAVEGRR